MKNQLPEEYIVKCDNEEQTRSVVDFIHNSNCNYSHWLYVIQSRDLPSNIYNRIPEEVRHLPSLSFEEWDKLSKLASKEPKSNEPLIESNTKTWFCTPELRWKLDPKYKNYTQKNLYKTLEQKWVTEKGEEKWVPIPTVKK